MTGMVPTCPSLAPCSPPSRPLRAASGGGPRPVLTAAARGAIPNPGRDEETAPSGRTKKRLWLVDLLHKFPQPNWLIRHPGRTPSDRLPSKEQQAATAQWSGTWVGTFCSVIAHQQRAAMLRTRSAQPIGASGHRTAQQGRIHDRSRPNATDAKNSLPNGGRPYMTACGRAGRPCRPWPSSEVGRTQQISAAIPFAAMH